MKNFKKYLFAFYILIFIGFSAFSQIEELEKKILLSNNDTTIINLRIELTQLLLKTDPEKALEQSKIIVESSEKVKRFDKKSMGYHQMGTAYYYMGLFEKGKEAYEEAAKIRKSINDYEGLAKSLSNLTMIYKNLGDFDKALDISQLTIQALKISNDSIQLGNLYNNIGLIYYTIEKFDSATHYYYKSLEVHESINYLSGISNAYGNLGNVYESLKESQKALEFHKKSLEITKKEKNEMGIALSFINIGNAFLKLNQKDSALYYYLNADNFFKEVNSFPIEKSHIYLNIGNIYFHLEEFDLAEKYLKSAIEILELYEVYDQLNIAKLNFGILLIEKNKFKEGFKYLNDVVDWSLKNSHGELYYSSIDALSMYYSKTNNYKKAYDLKVEYIQLRDSMINEDNKKMIYDLSKKYEDEKKQLIISNLQTKNELDSISLVQSNLEKTTLKKQKSNLILVFSIIFIFLISITYVIYKLFTNKKKSSEIIEKQKVLVEEKNKEIMDSINYAKRIQEAYMPPENTFHRIYPNGFILYKPKDVVCGDFYWFFSNHESNISFLASADCTGHGVPGAIMSIICCNALNEVVVNRKITDTDEILNQTREIVKTNLKSSDMSGQKDGMDISLVALQQVNSPDSNRGRSHSVSRSVSWSGANNPIWIIRKGANEIEEIKGDKQPIGLYENEKPFTKHEIQLNEGDIFYLFTDGFQDQFGGEKGKKFKALNLKSLLISIQHKEMKEQKQIILNEFENWKGDLEQVDDVCIIGVRV